MDIRSYTPTDFSELEALLKATGVYYEPMDQADILARQIRHDPESILVGVEDGKVIGSVFVLFNPCQSLVYHLAVDPAYQRRRYGAQLMDRVEQQLKDRGVAQPTLFVEEGNEEVVGFYEKRGWFVLYPCLCLEKVL